MAIKDKAASTLARLRNKSILLDSSYQQVLLLFCQEEFIRRIQESPYRDHLILKGGLFLYFITNFGSRATMDADFLLHNISNKEDDIRHMLERIIAAPTENNFLTFEIKQLSPIAINQHYHGIQATMVAHIKRVRVPFFVDFGVGDIIFPAPKRRSFIPLLNDNEPPKVLTYSIESTIAEKYDAIVQRKEQTSRMKDFFDIAFLSKTFSFEGRTVLSAIRKTFEYRGTMHHSETFSEVTALAQNQNMHTKWKHFSKGLGIELPFEQVMSEIERFLQPVVEAMMEGRAFEARWSPEDGWH